MRKDVEKWAEDTALHNELSKLPYVSPEEVIGCIVDCLNDLAPKIKVDAVRDALNACKSVGYTQDFYGTPVTYNKVEYADLVNYIVNLEQPR